MVIAARCTVEGAQGPCGELAVVLVFWPGQPAAPRCDRHAQQTARIAEAMGFALPMVACVSAVQS